MISPSVASKIFVDVTMFEIDGHLQPALQPVIQSNDKLRT